MRRDGCTEIWKHEVGWLYRNMEARVGMAIQKYGSMEMDGCTKYGSTGRDVCTKYESMGRNVCT
jgi:hypothetical protein